MWEVFGWWVSIKQSVTFARASNATKEVCLAKQSCVELRKGYPLGRGGQSEPRTLYVVTLFYEWLLFVLVVAGVRRSGASVLIVLGDHWHSVRQPLRDIGIAAGFWIVAAMLLWIFGWLLRIAALGRNVPYRSGGEFRPSFTRM